MDKKQLAVGILFFFSLCDLAWWAIYCKYSNVVDKGMRIAKAFSSFIFGGAWYLAGQWQIMPSIWGTIFAAIWFGIGTWHIGEIADKS